MSALDVQVGGDHYKKYKIQPMEYSMANGLDACQHTAIKYITRFRDKGGIADLEKAKHCIDMLIEFEQNGTLQTDVTSLQGQALSLAMANVPKGASFYWPKTQEFFKVEGFKWEVRSGNEWYQTTEPSPEVRSQLMTL
jgi:Protein of unknwon function (DUF3310).